MANLIIFGASRGLGNALSVALPTIGDTVWLVSRSRPESLDRTEGIQRQWIQADLTVPGEAAKKIADALNGEPIDVLIYNAALWEKKAFAADYNFEEVELSETVNILSVNLTAAIVSIQKLLPNLRQSANPKIILIGSTSGLENADVPTVAYAASKFGLRGVAHALRETLRREAIGVTCINPGDFAEATFAPGSRVPVSGEDDRRIPVEDLIAIIRCVIGLSRATCLKEIDLPAMTDHTA